jgi:SSS family transporter
MAGSGIAVGIDHVLVIGGDDGRCWGQDLRDAHPGFACDMMWAYHTLTDTWVSAGELRANHVTTVALPWKDTAGTAAVVVPSGEIRPGVRSPAVLTAPFRARKASFGYVDYLVLTAYLAALVAMGFYFSRREKSTEDFFLAGKRVPWWAAGLSIFGTQLSAITFMAIPGKTYADDWVFFWQNMGIVAIAPLVAWVYLPFFRRLDVTTAYEYLEWRFSLGIRLLGSASFVAFQLGRMGIVVFLPALALSAVTGWNVYACIAAMGVLATIYTVLGGIEAVIWTDVLQVVVLLGGAVVALGIIVGSVEGGAGEVFSVAAASDKLRLANLDWDFTSEALIVILLGAFFNNIVPYTTDQAVIQRYLTTSDERQARNAIWTNAILTIPASLLFFAVGTALWVFYKTHPTSLAPLQQVDQVFPWFIAQELPMGIAGLVIAGIFAAAMSSLDSGMNSVATACVTDFYRRFHPEASDHYCLNLARWLTLLLGVLGTGTAMLMATFDIKSLWELFLALIGLLGGTLAGLFALGIFTRRAAGVHAWIGAIASAAVLIYAQCFTQASGLLYAAIGATSCFVVGWLVSWLVPAKACTDGLTLFTRRRDAVPPA